MLLPFFEPQTFGGASAPRGRSCGMEAKHWGRHHPLVEATIVSQFLCRMRPLGGSTFEPGYGAQKTSPFANQVSILGTIFFNHQDVDRMFLSALPMFYVPGAILGTNV